MKCVYVSTANNAVVIIKPQPRFSLPIKPLEPLSGGMTVTAKTVKTIRFTAQNSKSEFG
uniref:Uncharacterized protein n=1 Tax=Arundo donax TaxID=35708 RepID=A0A0A9HHD1_ARUDO